ncbi:Vacuolar fusion protein mon1 [Saitoella coloradoensis]
MTEVELDEDYFRNAAGIADDERPSSSRGSSYGGHQQPHDHDPPPIMSRRESLKSLAPTILTIGDVERDMSDAVSERLSFSYLEEEDEESEDDEELTEEERLDKFRQRPKNFLILSRAGKPIYATYGDELLIAGYVAVIQTIISFWEDVDDQLQSFEAGPYKFVVMAQGGLYLVAISSCGESEGQLRTQLDALYMQIVSTLTLPALNSAFSRRGNFDLRRLLGGTDVFLRSLGRGMCRGFEAGVLVGGAESLWLRQRSRASISKILLSSIADPGVKGKGSGGSPLLYGILVAPGGQLIDIVRPRQHSLHPSDLHLLFNMLYNSSTFSQGEHWLPICLPKFNSNGFLYVYLGWIGGGSGNSGTALRCVLVSAEKESFFALRGVRERIEEEMREGKLLGKVEGSMGRGRKTCAEIGAGYIRHFLYKSRANVQFVMPPWGHHYTPLPDRRRLGALYHKLHAAIHEKQTKDRLHQVVTETETGFAWVTPEFELYCVGGPRVPMSVLVQNANMIVKWVRREEGRLFCVDNSPTKRSEIWAWYSYAFAAEVVAVTSVGTFIPIVLESLAAKSGVLASDHVTPCLTQSESATAVEDGDRCVLVVFGRDVDTASYALYVFSLSVVLQAIAVVSMSGAADHGNYRKLLLLAFTVVGAVAAMMFGAVETYLLAGVCACLVNICLGAAFTCLNSFLPVLCRSHPKVLANVVIHDVVEAEQQLEASLSHEDGGEDTETLLRENNASPRRNADVSLALSSKISGQGIAAGYLGAIIFQLSVVLVLMRNSSSTSSAFQSIILITGVWWLLFSIPVVTWMKPRPGPPLSLEDREGRTGVWGYIRYSWRALWGIMKAARQLKDISLFLSGWFLLSDAYTTMTGTAILFAKTTLKINSSGLAIIGLFYTLAGILGAYTWPRIAIYFHLSPLRTMYLIITLSLLVPLYGMLGLIPGVKEWGAGGLTRKEEMFFVAPGFGFLHGGLRGFCRSLYGGLVVRGQETSWFALYSITDEGSSALGPAVVALIVSVTGEMRYAFVFLFLMLGACLPVFKMVDVERGKADAERFASS